MTGLIGLIIALIIFFTRFLLSPLGLGRAPSKVLGQQFFKDKAADLSFLTLLIDGEQAFGTIFNSIENAKRNVFIQAFIWRDDATGNRMVKQVIKATASGAFVTIRKDLLGSYFEIKDMIKGKPSPVFANSVMRGHGAIRIITNLFDSSDHSKYYIVDREKIILGGMNIALEYRNEMHDYMVMVNDLTVVMAMERKLIGDGAYMPKTPGLFLATNNHRKCEIITAYLEMIRNAKERVILQHAYFSDREIISTIIEVARHGIQVDVIIPKSPDVNVYANLISINVLLGSSAACNINVWLYPGSIHAKVGLADGKVAAVGSANFTHRSMRRNRELTLFVHGSPEETFISDLSTQMEIDIKSSELVKTPVNLSTKERLLALYDYAVW